MSQQLGEIHDKEVRSSKWFKDGWVFQERILAPRLLTFSRSQILWGCSELQAAETWPCGKTSKHHIDRFVSVEVEKARLSEVFDKCPGSFVSHAPSWTLLQDYMSTKLAILSDRLPAIRGVAALAQQMTGERYCSGFWIDSDDVAHALLWRVEGGPRVRPAGYRARRFLGPLSTVQSSSTQPKYQAMCTF